MDLYYTSLSVSALLLLLLLLKLSSHGGGAKARLPPGPWRLPIIGSLHHLLGPLPHRSLTAMAKRYGPVIYLKLGEVPTLVVSSPAAAAEIMKTQDISFANRPMNLAAKIMSYGGMGLIFAPYGSYWRELRKMSILELLSVRRVQSFRPNREEEALNLVRSIASLADAGSMVNLSSMLMQLTNDVTARALIGGKCRYQKEFLRILNEAMEEAGGFSLVDLFPSSASLISLFNGTSRKLQRLHRDQDIILDNIIQEHKERKPAMDEQAAEDVVDVLLRIQNDGSLPIPLTDESIKAITMHLFGAGSETSARVMEWAMSQLMRDPAVMERAQREVRDIVGGKEKVTEEDVNKMSYLRLVIKETMRLHPPLPFLLPRYSHETREVSGYQIPANTTVLVNAWALARDPQLWEDAEEFKPERFEMSAVDFKGTNLEFIPFGAGRRMCPGMAFGMASVELPLACLLYYFDWKFPGAAAAAAADDAAEKQPKKHELDMTETCISTLHRKSELCLLAIPRIPCPTLPETM